MPLKTYGIFTAYGPGTEFRYEGLGRYLATFVRQGIADPEVRFLIACPSWSRQALSDLLRDAGVDPKRYEFVGPERRPLLLSLYEALSRLRAGRRRGAARSLGRFKTFLSDHFAWAARTLGVTRNPVTFALSALYVAGLGLLSLVFVALGLVVPLVQLGLRRWGAPVSSLVQQGIGRGTSILRRILRISADGTFRSWLFQFMHRNEVEAIVEEITPRSEVIAWYCPTAMWPSIARAGVPSLICVPDVVLSEFPVAFATSGGEPMAEMYKGIQATLAHARNFVTYSDRTKWAVMVDRFGVDPDRITVIPHAPNRLDQLIEVTGFDDREAASEAYCRTLVEAALQKAAGAYPRDFHGTDFRFIFYASQLRPSKNVVQLLRAFRYLLKERYFGRKLVLTADPRSYMPVFDYVHAHGLQNDVVFVPGLTDAQLAAFYKLADLAVCPSMSEGGMPFTFTEAISVGTPVVMSDIPVTREVLAGDELQDLMLFDPYDWQSMARRIEEALAEPDALYRKQRSFYDRALASRTWGEVVAEHLAIMDGLGGKGSGGGQP